ncbi:AAA family ATPase [Corynebacterium dentalis]|uniref:AAA family ATPase n=1 Tax=Corynebacterium dentalis TaxID=2014528 RepID=UPI00289D0181|nr:AAA family ATPase [Corynebacterium dentalis]
MNKDLELLRESRNIYHALAVISQQTDHGIDLTGFSYYESVDDQIKLNQILNDCDSIDGFLLSLRESDSDLARAITSVRQKQDAKLESFGGTSHSRQQAPNQSAPNQSRYSALGYFLDGIKKDHSYERKDAIQELAVILNKRTTNNVILCAKPGVGKTHLVEAFAATQDCRFPIFYLDLPRIIAATKYRGELETKLVTIFSAAIKENFILFVDEVHTLATTGAAEGGVALLDILKPYLLNPDFRMIGATTPTELGSLVQDSAFSRRFSFMRLPDLNVSQVRAIYQGFLLASDLETVLGMEDFEPMLSRLNTELPERNYPDKMLDFLEYAESLLKTLGRDSVTSVSGFLSGSLDRYLSNRFT